MKQIIRCNTFETNSSSMHSLIIMSVEDYNKFENYELFFNRDTGSWSSKEEMLKDSSISFDDVHASQNFGPNYNYYGFGSMEIESEKVYDKDGNEKMAVSMFIWE